MKWNARVDISATLDFEIEAENEDEVNAQIEYYLKFVGGGKAEGQCLTVKTNPCDNLTHVFVMEKEINDVYELD